jgi:exopolysaccharide production protein ExoQ
MNPQAATLLCLLGICGLFKLDYDRKGRTSPALWLPTVWLAIAGSRAVSLWLDMSPSVDQQVTEGSPLDRNIFFALLLAGVIVLIRRGLAVTRLLKANGPIVLFVLYCVVSIAWSDYPDIAFKRWTKSLGDFVMTLTILTDRNPELALKRVVTRLGFVFVPLSVLLIKYFPQMGRYYSPFEGTAFYCGVAHDKNMLGKICLVLGLGLCWRLYEEWSGERRTRVVLAVGTTIGMLLWLFHMANSMTSLSCFFFGNSLLLATRWKKILRNRKLVHLMVATVILVSFAVLFLDVGQFALEAMGRNPTLTGRTELWGELRTMVVNPVLGTGFESFWLGTRLDQLARAHWWHPNEAHDGYFEVYLNLGWMGIVLLAMILISGYRGMHRRLYWDAPGARVRLAYFAVAIAYNYTESAIRTLDPMWFILVFSLFAVPRPPSGIAAREESMPDDALAEVPA